MPILPRTAADTSEEQRALKADGPDGGRDFVRKIPPGDRRGGTASSSAPIHVAAAGSTRATRSFLLDRALIVGLFLLAGGLRFWGIWSSLPYVDNIDEPNVVGAAVRIVKSGDLNPHWFQYPGLFIYAEAAVYRLNLAWGTLLGYYTGPQSLPDSSYNLALAPDLYTWGRTLVVLVGAAAVAGTFVLGRSMFGRAAGLAAALLLAISPLHILNSHHVTTDVTMGAAGLAVLAASWRLANAPDRRIALVTGALVGLCAAAKYNGALLALPAATAWALGAIRMRNVEFGTRNDSAQAPGSAFRIRHSAFGLVGMAAASIAVFLVLNPYMILDWKEWAAGFGVQYTAYKPAADLGAMWTSLYAQVGSLLQTDPGIVYAGLAGAGLLVASIALAVARGELVWRRAVALLLLVPFPLLYLAAMSRFSITYSRNLVVLLPFLCLLAGGGLVCLGEMVARWLPRLSHRMAGRVTVGAPVVGALVVAIMTLALVAQPAYGMANLAVYLGKPDSRNLAYDWVVGQLKQGKRVATELGLWRFCPPDPFTCALPDVYSTDSPVTNQPPDWYARGGYDYVMLVDRRSLVLEDRAAQGDEQARLLAPYRDLPEVAHFDGDHEGGKGPYILVLKVGDGLADARALPGVARGGAQFGQGVQLWGYAYAPIGSLQGYYDPVAGMGRLPAKSYKPGQAIGLSLYLRVPPGGAALPAVSGAKWTVGLRLLDPKGSVVQRLDIQPVSNWHIWPPRLWYSNAFMAGVYNVPLSPHLAGGSYRLTLQIYDAQSGRALPVSTASIPHAPVGAGGSPPDEEVDLGALQVAP